MQSASRAVLKIARGTSPLKFGDAPEEGGSAETVNRAGGVRAGIQNLEQSGARDRIRGHAIDALDRAVLVSHRAIERVARGR